MTQPNFLFRPFPRFPRFRTLSPRKALLPLCAALALLAACGGDKDGKGQGEPVAVTTQVVQVKTLPITGEFTGRTDSASTVEIRARVQGILKQIAFQEGSMVKAGDLLFVIDPVEQQTALAKSGADVQRARALLDNARKERARFEILVKQGAVSQQEYDARVTNERQLAADLAATGATAQEARTTLGYTRITAPQSGRIGTSKFKVGALVGPGDNSLLATISTTDNFYVNFSVSERDYLVATKEMLAAKAKGLPPKPITATVVLADGGEYPHGGVVDMAERAIDTSTGTLPLRAVFPNPDGLIKPGLFAKVRLDLGMAENATLVSEQAVSDIQGAKFVFVVDKDGTAQSRAVELGPRLDVNYVVLKGLASGETVIVDGWQKVRSGMPVVGTPATPAASPMASPAAPPAAKQ